MSKPRVSVIMPVYNAEKYLDNAIQSILAQTYEDFELIMIDDGSTDKSAVIIKSYQDPRIVFRSRPNKGQTATLNEGLKMARGEYIARHDADDISSHDRFEKQVEFMDQNPLLGLLGTNYMVIHEHGEPWFTSNMFTRSGDIKLAIIFANQFGHGTVMIRRSVLEKSGEYDEDFRIAQDYDLWSRIARVAPTANLKDSLYRWRYYEKSLSTSNTAETTQEAFKIRDREFQYLLNHRKEFEKVSLHPFSNRLGPIKYLRMKNSLYRNMALLYVRVGRRGSAVLSLLVAGCCTPWAIKTYRYMWAIAFRPNCSDQLKYDENIE